MALVQGGDMMLFLEGKSIAYAKSHTLEINCDTQDVSSKDSGGGDWAANEAGILSWTASTENMFGTGEGNDYDMLYNAMIAKTPVNCVFAHKAENTKDVPTGGWTPDTPSWEGQAIITSLSANFTNGEYASYTANFTGNGGLFPSPVEP